MRDRTPLTALCKDERGSNEIGYVYTVMLSSLILSAVVVSVGDAVNENNRAVAASQVTEIAARLAVAVEESLAQIRTHPEQPLLRKVDLVHQGFGYVVLVSNEKIKVTEKVLHGSVAEIIIYNDVGIIITGRVESSAPFLMIDYLPGSGEMLIRAPISGT